MRRKYLLDSNAVTDLLNQKRGVDLRAVEESKLGSILATATPVVGELYRGAEASQSRERNLVLLNRGL